MKQLSKTQTLVGALVATWALANPPNALAQSEAHAAPPPNTKAVPTSVKQMTSVDKMDAAQNFSMSNDRAIGVFINLANPPEVPEEKLLAGIKGAFAHKRINAHVEVNQSEKGDITTVTFFREGTPFSFDLKDAFGGFNHVTQGMGPQGEELHSAIN